MLKSLKNARRRSVETVLEAVGASQHTVDEEFDIYHKNFSEMMEDLNECGAAYHTVLVQQKTYFHESVELAKCLERIYTRYEGAEYWPNVDNELKHASISKAYAETVAIIHETYRSSNAKSGSELSLTPMREAVTAMGPGVEKVVHERAALLKDYDSYQRRLKVLKGKAEAATGKPNEAEAMAEVSRYEGKMEKAKEVYSECNLRAKKEIEAAKKAHDQLVDMQLITSIVTQADLFSRAAEDLQAVVSTLPQDKVTQVRNRMTQYIRQGGAKVAVQEKSKLSTAADVALGKARFSELKSKSPEEEEEIAKREANEAAIAARIIEEDYSARGEAPPPVPTAPPPAIPPAAPRTVPPAPLLSSRPPAAPSQPPAPPPTPPSVTPPASVSAPPPPPVPPLPNFGHAKMKTVVALFDHDIEEPEELPFKAGDKIIVLDSSDEGWWKGRHKSTGAVGIFPVNYVKETDK